MKKNESAMSALRAAVDAYRADAARVNESEEARLTDLEAARRCRDEAMQEDRLDDYRFFCERVHHFEGMRFEILPPDFSEEIGAAVSSWGDAPGDASKALAAAVVQRIAQQAEILELLDGLPLPADVRWFDDAAIVRALIADGLLPEADWLWFVSICLDREYIDREACPEKLHWFRKSGFASGFPKLGKL